MEVKVSYDLFIYLFIACAPVEHVSSEGVSIPEINIGSPAPTIQNNTLKNTW